MNRATRPYRTGWPIRRATVQRRDRYARGFSAFLALFLSLISAGRLAADEVSDSEKRLADSLRYLSSDELEGRGLTTQGINKAADFIAKQFRNIGLKTEIFEKSPFQPFE